MVLPKMQGVRASKEADADLQSPKDPDRCLEALQTKGILLLKAYNVPLPRFSFVDYPVNGLDLTNYIINPDLPH